MGKIGFEFRVQPKTRNPKPETRNPKLETSSSMNEIQKIYQERLDRFMQAFQADNRLATSLSYSRLAAFLGGSVLSYLALDYDFKIGIGVTAVALVVFLLLVKRHAVVEARRNRSKYLKQVNEKELKALEREYAAFADGAEFIDPKHAFSYDLDLFGPRSLFQYLNRTASVLGTGKLAGWFRQPFLDADEIRSRQQAIQDISQRLDFRQNFQAIGEEELENETGSENLIQWLKEEPFFLTHKLYPILRFALPVLLLIISGLFLFIPQISWHFPIGMMIVNLIVVRQVLDRTNTTHALLGKRFATLNRYGDLLYLIEQEDFKASLLQSEQAKLKVQDLKASVSIKELAGITRAFDQRFNAFAAFLLNATILWDIVCMFRLEKWKAQAQDELPAWFEVLGEFDALLSLGNFAYNHPDFCLPAIQQEPFAMKGIEMGHVLLDPAIRVDNTLELEGDGQYIIITGANMAGKSTFLRTVGTNLILAMMGSPVCAKSFTFSPLKLHTSVRATDSLQDHESYFYAELVRLKAIVDRLKAGERLFVILDEMLRGTNSRDKQAGSRGFIEQLIQLKGMGLVATHDLSLGTLMDEHPDQVRNMRFEVDIHEDRLDFDYKLKPGISQNLNATFLMKKMGIVE